MSFKRRIASVLGLLAVATGTLVVGGAATESASAATCPRGHSWEQQANTKVQNMFSQNYVPIRANPFAGCTQVGTGQMWHDGALHCWIINSYGNLWIHLWDNSIAINGWVDASNLVGNLPAPGECY